MSFKYGKLFRNPNYRKNLASTIVNRFGDSVDAIASSITELIGTGLAAAIIALIGSSGAIYLDMATFVISALLIAWMKIPAETLNTKVSSSAGAYFKELKDGFVYCKGKKILVVFAYVALFLNGILVPINSLQTPIRRRLHF